MWVKTGPFGFAFESTSSFAYVPMMSPCVTLPLKLIAAMSSIARSSASCIASTSPSAFSTTAIVTASICVRMPGREMRPPLMSPPTWSALTSRARSALPSHSRNTGACEALTEWSQPWIFSSRIVVSPMFQCPSAPRYRCTDSEPTRSHDLSASASPLDALAEPTEPCPLMRGGGTIVTYWLDPPKHAKMRASSGTPSIVAPTWTPSRKNVIVCASMSICIVTATRSPFRFGNPLSTVFEPEWSVPSA